MLQHVSINKFPRATYPVDLVEVLHHAHILASLRGLLHVALKPFEANLLHRLRPCQISREPHDAHAQPLHLIDARTEHLACELA